MLPCIFLMCRQSPSANLYVIYMEIWTKINLTGKYAINIFWKRVLLHWIVLLFLSAAPIRGRHSGSTVSNFSWLAISLSDTATTCTSSLTTSINFIFGLPLLLLPGSSKHNILLPIYSTFRLCTCPYHLNLAFLILSPICSNWIVQSTNNVPVTRLSWS